MKTRSQSIAAAGIIALISVFVLTCGNSNPSGPDNKCAAPAVPRDVKAEALSMMSVKISWGAIPTATKYEVHRSTNQNGTYSVLSDVSGDVTDYTDSLGLSPSTTYYYKVRARNDCGQSALSSHAQATTNPCLKPTVPTNVSAEALSALDIKISWDAVPAATVYEVYRSTGADDPYSLIDTVTNKTNYTNEGLTPSSTHYYKIVAKNVCGESVRSESANATTNACPKPAAPANATAEAVSSSGIKISWDKVTTALSYKIYRSTTSTGTYVPVGNTSGNASTSWTDENLELATTYYYKVTAESYCEESAQSNYTFAETMNCSNKPAAPTNIRAETVSQTEIKVSWDAVSGATSYTVYTKQHDGTIDYYDVGSVKGGTTISIGSRAPGETYDFKVKAKNSCGESALSESYATATTEDCDLDILPNPEGITVTALSARSVLVTWEAVDGAVYDVYRSTDRYSNYWTGWTGSKSRDLKGTSFTDTTVSSSTTYYYAVKSINECGKSKDGLDNVVSVTTMCETSIPLNVSATAKSSAAIEISWSAVSGAGIYYVYRATSSNGTYAKIGNVSTPLFIDGDLIGGTTYHYKVTAKSADCDESRFSERVSAIAQ